MNTAKKVAVNTALQYIQMGLGILISLYSVRLILAALGKIDYGIYDVVGGVVVLFTFISSSLAQASMRFISLGIGSGDKERVRKTFSTCFWLHMLLATVLVLLIEVAGLFLFSGFLDIPTERLQASKIVYHCVTLTLFLNVIRSPFNALIASYEQFWYSTIIALLNSLLKLAIAIAITYWFSDKLIAYGVLLMLITVIDFILIILFVFRQHRIDISFVLPRKKSMSEMVGFMGWIMLDVLGYSLTRQGYAVMLNRFFGPIVNTTFALSRQVSGPFTTISSSAVYTMKPQIMKSYGAGDEDRSFRLSMTAGKIGFALMTMLSIPVIIMLPEVLDLWLGRGNYPEDTILFTRLLLVACMFEQLTEGLVFANQAVGNIKWFSIIVSSIRISALPLSCVFLWFGSPAFVAIIVFLFCEALGTSSRVVILSRISKFNMKSFFRQVIFMILPPVLFAVVFCYFLYRFVPHSIIMMVLTLLVTASLYSLFVYRFGLTGEERLSVQIILKTTLGKFFKKKQA